MDREERNDRIKDLMALAAEHGFLTFEDINETFPEDLVAVEDIDKIIGLLQSRKLTSSNRMMWKIRLAWRKSRRINKLTK